MTRPGRMRQEGAMPKLTVAPRIRSFICLNAHPAGCAANVEREIGVATAGAPGSGLKHALVIGASTGYGLSSLVTRGVRLRRARHRRSAWNGRRMANRTASAGYYNLAAAQRLARARGRQIVGDQRRRVLRGGEAGDAGARRRLGREAGLRRLQPGGAQAHRRKGRRHLQLGAEADRRAVPQPRPSTSATTRSSRSRSRPRPTPRSKRRAR